MRATTKIVATLGPSTDSETVLHSLFEAGVDVFRLNAPHGSQADHAQRIQRGTEIVCGIETHPGILLDLQGPKIRLGTFKDGPQILKEGA